jgi:3-oxoacyl-[acyl-carrier-protein] synthase III
MRFNVPGVRIADVATCDFRVMQAFDTETLLRTARPADAEQLLSSAVARRMLREMGISRRYLTHVPGRPVGLNNPNALDLARSAISRLMTRRKKELQHLDAVIFSSTSNPNPCNCQAAILADEFGLGGLCMDVKAGCSTGLIAVVQAALLVQAGCERVLVIMAENLSRFAPPHDLRMLCTVGDGAACILVERSSGPGFLAVTQGTEARFARSMAIKEPFPPSEANARYQYEFTDIPAATQFLQDTWRSVISETVSSAGIRPMELSYAAIHQTNAAQVRMVTSEVMLPVARVPIVVDRFGNMGTPTFAVALSRVHSRMRPGDRYLLLAIGGGISWCGIVAEHS